MSVEKALLEIDEIERRVKPYRYFSSEAKMLLNVLDELKIALNNMDKPKIKQSLEALMKAEEMAAPYRSFGFIEEILNRIKILREELAKIISD